MVVLEWKEELKVEELFWILTLKQLWDGQVDTFHKHVTKSSELRIGYEVK